MLCRISRNRLYRFHYNNRQRSNPLPIGDPVGIQTQDLQNRNLTLYSAKLRGQSECKGSKIIPNSLTFGPINVAEPCFF